jgi:hypothetical protein
MGVWLQSFACGYPVFPTAFIEEAIFSPGYVSDSFVKNQMTIAIWVSILLFWFTALCHCHAVFVTRALRYNLKSGIVMPPALLFCSGLLWLFGVLYTSI